MEITIIGLSKSGKTVIFNALTKGHAQVAAYAKSSIVPNIGVTKVPDPRLEILEKLFKPAKVTKAEIKYIDIAVESKAFEKGGSIGGQLLNYLSNADALIQVIRSFKNDNIQHLEGTIDPVRDIAVMDLELVYSDLVIIERRLERIETELKSVKSAERDLLNRENILLQKIKSNLEKEVPIWQQGLSSAEMMSISSYQFLTAKPMLFILNVGEDQIEEAPAIEDTLRSLRSNSQFEIVTLCGQLEMELAQLSDADAREFRSSMGLTEGAVDQILSKSYQLLGLISFFTVVSSELKVWTIPEGTIALKAAGKIHTDMEKGFIRAEVISFNDLTRCGDMAEARKNGLLRLEGKNYTVQDGDIITFLFNT